MILNFVLPLLICSVIAFQAGSLIAEESTADKSSKLEDLPSPIAPQAFDRLGGNPLIPFAATKKEKQRIKRRRINARKNKKKKRKRQSVRIPY